MIPPLHPPPKKKVDIRLDHSYPQLNDMDQGGVRGGVIGVSHPRGRHPVGKEVHNS